jgi:hypothetical protein
MVQGKVKSNKTQPQVNKQGSKRKEKKQAQKKAQTGEINTTKGKDETTINMNKQIEKHQKKVYKSIEDTIIEKAKQRGRERFDII